jgi:hypothetical protein
MMKKVIVALVVLAVASWASAELLTDPGFESGTLNSWVNNGYYVGQNSDAHSGSYGAAVAVPTGVTAGNYYIVDQRVSVTAGLTYDASVWLRTAGTANNSESFLEIQWVNSSDQIMWVSPYASVPVSTVQDYTQFSLNTCTAPVGAVKADIRGVVTTTATTTGDTMYLTFDDFSFAQTIPEPGTLGLIGASIGLLAILRARFVK